MRQIKRGISLLLAIVMLCSLLPETALSVHAEDAISYVDAAGVVQSPVTDYSVIEPDTATLTTGWWVVKEDVRVETRLVVSGNSRYMNCSDTIMFDMK